MEIVDTSIDHEKFHFTRGKKGASFLSHFKVEYENNRIKLLILGIIIVFNGFSSVFSEVYLNEILTLAGYSLINPPSPSLMGFLNNFVGDSSLYIIIIIIFGMGSFSNEVEVNKQVYFTLSRPISRKAYFFTRTLLLTIGIAVIYIIASLIVYFYSLLFFEPISLDKIMLAIVMASLQNASFYAIMIMLSVTYNQMTAGILGFTTFLGAEIVTLIEPLRWFSPISLSGIWMDILVNKESLSDFLTTTFSLLLWIIVPIFIGWLVYKRKDL